ncbi:MAG: prepilin-type N-terminal cleavage/methylation domain-containing protein [Candidatus Omnitrophota bacterium]|jgi:general secretion pathway protein G
MKKGFTLLELLMVIMVIAILIGIALPRFRGMVEEGNIAKAKGELRTLQIAVESYYMHNSNIYPTTLTTTVLKNQSPQILEALPTDPFSSGGAGYQYLNGGTNNKYYAIWSVGPAGNGSVTGFADTTNDVQESNPASCIYVSNAGQDTTGP